MGDDLNTVKSIFRRILWANKGHLTCEEVLCEYRRCTGESFCCTNYGYTSLQHFLESVTDVIIVQRGPNDEIFLRSVDDGASSRIQKLIENQRNRKQILRKITSSERQSTTECGSTIQTNSINSQTGRRQKIHQSAQEKYPSSDIKPTTAPLDSLGSPRPVLKMDQRNPGRGRGRGRGLLLQEALAVANCQTRSEIPGTTENIATSSPAPSGESSVADEDIKMWIVKEVTPVHGGLWASSVPSLFANNFKKPAPDDLLAKIRSWSDVIVTEMLLPGEIFKLKRQEHQVQRAEDEDAKPQESSQESTEKTEEKSTTPKASAAPQAGSSQDVHVEGTNSPREFCSRTVIPGTTSRENLAATSSHPSGELSVPDKFIKIWIVRELSPKSNGIWAKEIPSLFEKNFKMKPPPGLLAKLQSWSDVIETLVAAGGNILTLKKQKHQMQKAENGESKPQESTQVRSSHTKTTEGEILALRKVALPEEGSFLDVHAEWANSPGDFCSRTVIPGTTSPETATSSHPSGELSVPDKFIKIWIVRELSPKSNGIWAKEIPSLFEKNFKRKPPPDLLAKLQSWSDVIETLVAAGRNILTLKRQKHQMQKAENEVAKPQESTQVRSSHTKTTEGEILVLRKVALPEEGSFLDVHVEWANSPGDFCMIPHKMLESLRSMMQELNSQNEAMKPVQDSSLKTGRLCAGKYNGKWNRIIIKGPTSEKNMIQAIFPDFCYETELQTNQLAELPAMFHSIPVCGIRACLYGVAPAGGNQWSDKIIADFRTIVNNRDFVCLICEKDEEKSITEVRLIDTSGEDDVIVDEILDELIYTQHV